MPTRAEIIRGTQPAVVSTLPSFGGVHFSLWGWLEAATVFRDHNQVNDMLTVFNAIPYPNSPLYKEHEFHGSARQSQFSFMAEGQHRFRAEADGLSRNGLFGRRTRIQLPHYQ
jgi:hypothetical protein